MRERSPVSAARVRSHTMHNAEERQRDAVHSRAWSIAPELDASPGRGARNAVESRTSTPRLSRPRWVRRTCWARPTSSLFEASTEAGAFPLAVRKCFTISV